ncbi:MAG: hypothetical protein QY324_00040 [Anaerolineales bacterium]|nr:MAG: hypothetical protein QY324_00040 [Anaerolineales bacterium]
MNDLSNEPGSADESASPSPPPPTGGCNESSATTPAESKSTASLKKTEYLLVVVGFILWFVIAGILTPISLGLITTPLTIIALISFGLSKNYKPLALGILVAVGLNFIISLSLGLTTS